MSAPTAPAPVFIIAAARSGTKFLRDTLAAAGGVAAVPYDINYIWRSGNDDLPHDELDPECISPNMIVRIRREVYRQAHQNVGPSAGVLVEKTVSNTLRVPFVQRIFPEARYIHLIRDGRDVVESSFRCWHERPSWRALLHKVRRFPLGRWRYAARYVSGLVAGLGAERPQPVWGPRYNGIVADLETLPLEVVVARQWRRCVEASLSGLKSVDAERVLTIRYEDLVRSEASIPRLLAFLGCPDEVEPVASHYRAFLRRPPPDRWMSGFTTTQREHVWSEIGTVVTELGYPS